MKTRARRPALSRDRILAAALTVVDREGLDAISMRRLGDELGVEAMSLYNHVAGKGAILDGIFEAILAELPRVARTASWRADIGARAHALRAVLAAHPNALPLFATRPAVTPASLEHVEDVLEVLGGAGFSAGDALAALQVLLAYVVGHTLQTHARVNRDDQSMPDYQALDPALFPRVRELTHLVPRRDVEQEFATGLDALIAGLNQARSRARRAGSAAPGHRGRRRST
jgi:AcrR family transcriptional regulator